MRFPAGGSIRCAGAGLAAIALAVALSACSRGNPTPTVAATQPPADSPSASPSPSPPPAMVGVTTGGALVTLSPSTGAVLKTLVPSGVIGDEVSVAPGGLVYFAVKNGCSSNIEEMPVTGGNVAVIVAGSLPAVSPDGTKLAYANQPSLTAGCVPNSPNLAALYHVAIRNLSRAATLSLPDLPAGQDGGLPRPISHLSWSADNQHLAVSVTQTQDNEGWSLTLLDTAQAQFYLGGVGVVTVPPTGSPSAQQSYLSEGVYMPDGNLFVSRACCAGFPVNNTSRLMWEVDTSGALVHQVAVGFANLAHTSLSVSSDGKWLLYLAGHDLYVSQGGATPTKLRSGLIAAAWG
ncbi:MAG: PD40 domain-containing protein [Actinobacteria bacterium]|nr:PD40 domain-containing protein [Actinomycetota bacterium]MBO0835613.1 PD40 domain-containing protein [Actinomycetota bacterium]